MNIKESAKKLPYPLQQGLKYIYGAIPPRFRYGKVFWDTYNFLQESQWWGREKLEEYQMRQLSKLLHHAYENVPYYRRVFNERGLKPKDIKGLDDLQRLPYLTKEIIRDNLKDLTAKNFSTTKIQYLTTGGSTGIPLGFYNEKSVSSEREWAFILTLWKQVGFRPGNRCVVLRGNVVKFAEKGKYWNYDALQKNLILSSYHLTENTIPIYIKKIRHFKPDFIQAYPSAITILARFMKENSIAYFPSVKAILCGSENLYQWQRDLLQEVFKCRIFSWYGHAEQAALAGECEKSNYYHMFPQYGLTELITKGSNIITSEDEVGEIIATGFNNYVTPFIRYCTADMAIYSLDKCKCNRNYALLKRIEGRLQEYIVDHGGGLIPLGLALFSIHDAEWTKVKQIQFLQEVPGELIIKVVKGSLCAYADIKAYILKLFQVRLKGRCNLKVEFVNNIPRTKNGKYRFLIQKLKINKNGAE